MKHSVKIRLIVTMALLLGGVILFCLFINRTFLGQYYQRFKVGNLREIYTQIDERYGVVMAGLEADEDADEDEKEEAYDALSLYLTQAGGRQSITAYVFNEYLYSGGVFLQIRYPETMNEMQSQMLRSQLFMYLMPEGNDRYFNFEEEEESGKKTGLERETVVIDQNDLYTISRRYDTRMEANYIELYGKLSNGEMVFLRTNFDNIGENVGIANRFFIYVGLIAILIGIVVTYFLGDHFVKPLKQLSGMATEMRNLNFDVRYEGKREDEVGELGKSINALSEKLESTISELKKANNELQSDIQQKEELEQMRTEFISNVTHELKTPIALIQGYAEGLKDNISDDPESRAFYCDVIMDESAKMNDMVKKLLTLSQLESGANQMEFSRFDIVELTKSVVQSMEMMVRQSDAVLDFPNYDPIYVWADEYRVEEVITNYVSNAIHYVHSVTDGVPGTVRIRILEQDGKVRVSVYNDGTPIPEDDVDKIWDKFYKVDKARTREYGGSGIGLSIVKAIMNSLNERFGVTNEPHGVTFWFELDQNA